MAMCFHQAIKIIFYDFNTMEFINDLRICLIRLGVRRIKIVFSWLSKFKLYKLG
jgi:hypothetical protein